MGDERISIKDVVEAGIPFNMGVWDLVCKSDPASLKKVGYGRGFMAIDAYPQIEMATKVFGPMGIGFGIIDPSYEIIRDVDSGSKDYPDEKKDIMIVSCVFWFKFPGSSTPGTIPILNSMPLHATGDVPKKLMTNCVSKALSYLGFNYDVFKGTWDDNPYTDRPDIPAPEYMIANLKTLLRYGMELGVFPKAQAKAVAKLQIDAGWTIQSVPNSLKACIDLFRKADTPLPTLLEEGETDGVRPNKDQVGEPEESGS